MADDRLVPSFVPDGEFWAAAIYALRPEVGPELVLRCGHQHPTMHRATRCAVNELRFAERVVELAERHREIPS